MNLTDEDLKKPLPVPTKWSQPFWDAAKEHRLVLRKCSQCGNIDHPPYLYCTACQADEHEWIEASGKGTLFAYAINYFGVPFPFWADLPYALGMIDVAGGRAHDLQHRGVRPRAARERHGAGGGLRRRHRRDNPA